jgi:hypothetical protein
MARAYTVGTAALALDVPAKWLDNVLSHFELAGVVQKHQGIARKVSLEGVLQLALALALISDLGIPTATALRLADTMRETSGQHRTPSGITIGLDVSSIRAGLETRLAQAVEIAPLPRRGRPPNPKSLPASKTGRLD